MNHFPLDTVLPGQAPCILPTDLDLVVPDNTVEEVEGPHDRPPEAHQVLGQPRPVGGRQERRHDGQQGRRRGRHRVPVLCSYQAMLI